MEGPTIDLSQNFIIRSISNGVPMLTAFQWEDFGGFRASRIAEEEACQDDWHIRSEGQGVVFPRQFAGVVSKLRSSTR